MLFNAGIDNASALNAKNMLIKKKDKFNLAYLLNCAFIIENLIMFRQKTNSIWPICSTAHLSQTIWSCSVAFDLVWNMLNLSSAEIFNPLSPHDALKHHFTSLKTGFIFLQLRVLEWKFPWNWFTILGNFLKFSNHFKSFSPTTCRELRQQFAACSWWRWQW